MFPRANFDADSRLWHNYGEKSDIIPSTLDFFDSFDELDHYFSSEYLLLNRIRCFNSSVRNFFYSCHNRKHSLAKQARVRLPTYDATRVAKVQNCM
jgi:hypothetical protein